MLPSCIQLANYGARGSARRVKRQEDVEFSTLGSTMVWASDDPMSSQAPVMKPIQVVEARELPDFYPPFVAGNMRPDLDGNLWIKFIQAKPLPGGEVFSIVNREGTLVERVQLPKGHLLVGFGRGRVVYLATRGKTGAVLEKVRLK